MTQFKIGDTVLIDGTYWCEILGITDTEYELMDKDDGGTWNYPIGGVGHDMCLWSQEDEDNS